MRGGLHSRLKALHSDSAEKIGSGPAPRNSLVLFCLSGIIFSGQDGRMPATHFGF
jgi:hypothetical protein